MVLKQHIIAIFSLVGLLNACAVQTNQSSRSVINDLDYPAQSAPLPITATSSKETESFYERFDFHIRNIVADSKVNLSLTVVPHELPGKRQPNPLTAVHTMLNLPQFSRPINLY